MLLLNDNTGKYEKSIYIIIDYLILTYLINVKVIY